MNDKEYDVVIIGSGVSGAALLYVLSNYTNIKNIAILEKYSKPAQVNSHHKNNSQTLHCGDIETNYTLEKAEKVKRSADMIVNYIKKHDKRKKTFKIFNKMVIAVGEEEVKALSKRYKQFKKLFPDLRLINKKELAKLEPKVVEGRPKSQKIVALSTPTGYTMNYQALAQSFIDQSTCKDCGIDIFFDTKVKQIGKSTNNHLIKTNRGSIKGKTLAVAAGAHSLLFAKSLGYGDHLALLSVAGSFYFAPKALNGKVYTMQLEKLPFAAVHGDPEVNDPDCTRFGPTAKVIPMLERHKYRTFFQYLKTAGFSLEAHYAFKNILSDKILRNYILLNLAYDLPFIGKKLFLKEAQKVIPTIKLEDLEYAEGYGGVRPQIVNKKTRSLDMGEAKLIGDKSIFNITPSPGASTCLRNAEDDAKKIIEFLGDKYKFNHKKFIKDLVPK